MTGEVTLSGKVLPIGGVKEKALGARRAGIKTILVPERNRKDVMENLPEEVSSELDIHFMSEVRDVLELALEPKPGAAVGENPEGSKAQTPPKKENSPRACRAQSGSRNARRRLSVALGVKLAANTRE